MKRHDIVIASGKGGTGKTTVSVVLALYSASLRPTLLCDCDVEEPDDNLFLNIDLECTDEFVEYPVLEKDSCTGCKRCAEVCNYNAIVMVKERPLIFKDLCHACNGCSYACSEGAIRMEKRVFGRSEYGRRDDLEFCAGRLNVKEVLSPLLIRKVKARESLAKVRIIDAPPGSACAAVTAISGASVVILVAEPTPFGFHDFKAVYEIVREMKIHCAVVINKDEGHESELELFCKKESIDIISRIPHDLELARSYSKGKLADYILTKYPKKIEAIYKAAGVKHV